MDEMVSEIKSIDAVSKSDRFAEQDSIYNARVMQWRPVIGRGASCFYYVAFITLFDTMVTTFDFKIVNMLMISRIVESIGHQFELPGYYFAIGTDLILIALFTMFGYFAKRQQLWAFIVGAVILIIDTLLVVFLEFNGRNLLWHCIAVYYVLNGCMKLEKLQSLKRPVREEYP